MNDARPWRAHHAAVTLGLGARKRRFCRLDLGLEIDELEARERAGHDQRALGVELGAFLCDHRLRLRHLRLARLVGQDGKNVALLDPHSALDLELGQDPAGARRDDDPLVRLGAAGDGELAAVRNDAGLRDRDAEQLLGLAFAGANGGVAFRRLAREKMAGGDP